VIGKTIGPYQILAELGRGGMGEVYRAKDTNLNRDVALKILPESFALDADRVARFKREAQVLASLNHPNIAQIYGIESNALVMELVEGEDLSTLIMQTQPEPERVAREARDSEVSGKPGGGAPGKLKNIGLPLDEALPIARQIADALEAAHEQGIVHRDLKPQNIKVRADGTVKVLDFGLAKAIDPAGASSGEAMNSPTMTARATQMGMIIGTAAYMAPEQAKGKAVDKRADIWAFGVVLYEMLTGRRCFDGEDISTTLAAVLMREPDWTALPRDTPPALESLIRRCLERDSKLRLRDIGEARLLLSNPQTLGGAPALMTPSTARPKHSERAVWIALGVVGALWIATLVPAVRYFRPQPSLAQLQFDVPTSSLGAAQGVALALSPDGRYLAYIANLDETFGSNTIWIRALDGSAQRVLPNTAGASQLFWAPDSQRLGFVASGKFQIIDIVTGRTQDVCRFDAGVRGVTWNASGDIVFARSLVPGSLFRVRDSGGTPVEFAKADPARQEAVLGFPQFLPDGRHFLYLSIGLDPAQKSIWARSLDDGPPVLIVAADSMPVYANGWLLYIRGTSLLAQKFEAGRLRLGGEPVLIADSVMSNANASGRFAFSASDTGLLAFRKGTGAALGVSSDLRWVSREGHVGTVVGDAQPYSQIRLSPNEQRVVFSLLASGGFSNSLWTIDLRNGVTSQLTVELSAVNDPVWSPDSESLAFESMSKGIRQFYRQAIGARSVTPIFESPDDPKWLDDWSRDGRFLLFHVPQPNGRLYALPVSGGPPTLLTESKVALDGAHFSPDGKWVAYQTNETSAYEVWVAAFPAFNQRRQVSARGGAQAFWRGDGRELYYLTVDGKMMSVAVTPAAGGALEFGAPAVLFQSPISHPNLTIDQYAVTGDGRRFLFVVPRRDADAPALSPISVRVNWASGLQK
jgi:serine/threonine protein kinase/Tol biopolymer transport system component